MAYYPKNKIKINLYTAGDEFAYPNSGPIYIGYYHKLYNGKYFTGKTPNDSNIKEIIPITLLSDNIQVDEVSNTPYSPIFPTLQDYKLGVFNRYFKVKRNQSLFEEISKSDYDTYKQGERTINDLNYLAYRVFSLPWELTGDPNKVAQTNKNITELTETRQKALGLGLFLKENWLQYYKETP